MNVMEPINCQVCEVLRICVPSVRLLTGHDPKVWAVLSWVSITSDIS